MSDLSLFPNKKNNSNSNTSTSIKNKQKNSKRPQEAATEEKGYN
jgi:hypothetical protein